MSEHTFYKCEKCGATTENRYATKGWVHIEGTVRVSAGFYETSHRTAYLDKEHDFCSVSCFVAKIEEIMPRPSAAATKS